MKKRLCAKASSFPWWDKDLAAVTSDENLDRRYQAEKRSVSNCDFLHSAALNSH